MNIGQMLRAAFGDSVPADPRLLELRIGQIVRGVLIEMLENNEAKLNIGGTVVRARLETELPAGKGTLFQVQPGSAGGLPVLKPLADPSEALPEEGLKNVLKSFGMPDQKWAHELIRGLKRDGFAMAKDTAAFFLAAAAAKPAGTDSVGWMAAADVAFRRGLPSSEQTIASLRQALFGQPLHDELNEFASAFKDWQASGSTHSPKAAELAVRLTALLGEGQRLLAQGESQLLDGLPTDGEAAPAGAPAGRPQSARPETRSAEDQRGPGGQAAPTGAEGAKAASTAFAPPETGNRGNPRTTAQTPGAGLFSDPGVPVDEANDNIAMPGAAKPQQDEAASGSNKTGKAEARQDSAWIGRFLDWLGAGHERGLAAAHAGRPHSDAAPGEFGGAAAQDGEQLPDPARGTADSLKSALLTLAKSEELPPILREAAQSLVNQITGQQLLLTSERQPQTPFSMMTMFIPMKGPDGDTTAAVHVQARRSRKGQWDPDNCRLLFDLRMRHLGATVVDVQVVDRIVSVKLMNDFPEMAELADLAREELGAGLRTAGFQLLSLTAQPLPKPGEPASAESSERGEKPESVLPSAYAAKPYKGVDYRA